jgi:hypothetical protein
MSSAPASTVRLFAVCAAPTVVAVAMTVMMTPVPTVRIDRQVIYHETVV